jgi:K+-sensing histidine kinase KdpD
MWIVKRAMPVAVALAAVSVVTAVLWLVRTTAVGPQHLVFFYLFPTVLVATLYGSAPAAVCAIAAALCAAFFLYEPLYSFYVDNLDLGELICFVGVALIGAKCTADLLRPASRRHGETRQLRNPAINEQNEPTSPAGRLTRPKPDALPPRQIRTAR